MTGLYKRRAEGPQRHGRLEGGRSNQTAGQDVPRRTLRKNRGKTTTVDA